MNPPNSTHNRESMDQFAFLPRPFTCETCGKTCESAKDLRFHVAQHKWGPHKVIHTDEGMIFQCLNPTCNRIVKDRKNLRKHLLTHQERKFACTHEGCNKKFFEKAKLKRHYLVHTGDKFFHCPYEGCDKEFAYKANLKTHIRTHTGVKPFACKWPGCNKKFAQASNRKSHMETHLRSQKRKRMTSTEDVYPSKFVPERAAPHGIDIPTTNVNIAYSTNLKHEEFESPFVPNLLDEPINPSLSKQKDPFGALLFSLKSTYPEGDLIDPAFKTWLL